MVKTRKQKRPITEEINEIKETNQEDVEKEVVGEGIAEQGIAEQGIAEEGIAKQGIAKQGIAEEGAVEEGQTSVEPSTQNIEPNDSYSNYEKEIESVN
ncbi:18664_t:CDS:2, partial [Racocetra fulgida]